MSDIRYVEEGFLGAHLGQRPRQANPYQSTRLLLDGQQRLTSLSALIMGRPVRVA
jgi:hypothetical protein